VIFGLVFSALLLVTGVVLIVNSARRWPKASEELQNIREAMTGGQMKWERFRQMSFGIIATLCGVFLILAIVFSW